MGARHILSFAHQCRYVGQAERVHSYRMLERDTEALAFDTTDAWDDACAAAEVVVDGSCVNSDGDAHFISCAAMAGICLCHLRSE